MTFSLPGSDAEKKQDNTDCSAHLNKYVLHPDAKRARQRPALLIHITTARQHCIRQILFLNPLKITGEQRYLIRTDGEHSSAGVTYGIMLVVYIYLNVAR